METNLSNLNLLNEEVAHNMHSETLKHARMQEAEMAANRPPIAEQLEKDNVIQMPNTMPQQPINQPTQNQNHMSAQRQVQYPQQHPNQGQFQSQNQQVNDNDDDMDDDNYSPNTNVAIENKSNVNASKKSDTILGMKPIVFYGILSLIAAGGIYLTYRHFQNKKGSAPKLNGSATPSVGSGAAKVAEAATETAKNTAVNVAATAVK